MNIYQQYKEIQQKIDTLEAAKETLREQIAKELPEKGLTNEFVNASWTTKKKWTYSAAVEKLGIDYKNAKVVEEHNGTAKFEEIKQLMVKVVK